MAAGINSKVFSQDRINNKCKPERKPSESQSKRQLIYKSGLGGVMRKRKELRTLVR